MFEISKAENGFVVLEGTSYGKNNEYFRKSWVATDPETLAALIRKLVIEAQQTKGE